MRAVARRQAEILQDGGQCSRAHGRAATIGARHGRDQLAAKPSRPGRSYRVNSRLSIRRVLPSRAAISATRGAGFAFVRLAQVGIAGPRRSRPRNPPPSSAARASASTSSRGVPASAGRRASPAGCDGSPARRHARRRTGTGCANSSPGRRPRARSPPASDLDRERQVAHHVADHRELLVILAAEHGDIGLHLVEQPRDHGATPSKWPGRCAPSSTSVMPGTLHAARRRRRRTDTSLRPTAATARRSRRLRARRRRLRACADSARNPRSGRTGSD